MRIGEFSKLARVTIRLLRHYDEIGLLKPAEVDESSGYRSYSVEQLPQLNKIMLLKELDLPLTEIKSLIESNVDNETLRAMLKKKQSDLFDEIEAAQMKAAMIDQRLSHLENSRQTLHHIVIKETPAVKLATIKRVVPDLSQMKKYCYEMYRDLYDSLSSSGISYYGNELTLYHTDCYQDLDNISVEVGVQVKENKENLERIDASSCNLLSYAHETHVASLIHDGPFVTVEDSATELIKWIMTNDYTVTGSLREWHLSGPAHQNGEVQASPIIELQMPIRLEND